MNDQQLVITILIALVVVFLAYLVLKPAYQNYPTANIKIKNISSQTFDLITIGDSTSGKINYLASMGEGGQFLPNASFVFPALPNNVGMTMVAMNSNAPVDMSGNYIQQVFFVSAVNVGGKLRVFYGGSANKSIFHVEHTSDNVDMFYTEDFNTPSIIGSPDANIQNLIPSAVIDEATGSASLPVTALEFPKHLVLTSYNAGTQYGSEYIMTTNDTATSLSVDALSGPNVGSSVVAVGTINANGYVYVAVFNADGTISTSVLVNDNNKSLLINLLGHTMNTPDFVLSIPLGMTLAGAEAPRRAVKKPSVVKHTLKRFRAAFLAKVKAAKK